MNNSIKAELKAHILNKINDGVLTPDNQDEWHFHAFNEDYYLIGYYNCEQWLEKHDVSAFEAIDEVVTYEKECFGEVNTKMNSESVVNMYVYIQGEELMSGIDTLEELEELCND
jgi:transcriptional regulator with PAS, ATPase and Fis domain